MKIVTNCRTVWYSIDAPGVFQEREFPEREVFWSREDMRAYDEMMERAESLGTHLIMSRSRRG